MSSRPSCGVHWDTFTTGSAILPITCTNGFYRRAYRTIYGLANIPSEGRVTALGWQARPVSESTAADSMGHGRLAGYFSQAV